MLYIVGLGLSDDDITLSCLESVKSADIIYIEDYTNKWLGSASLLERLTGKKIKHISREGVESDKLIKEAKARDVALLIPGDPFAATTHFELIIEAAKQNIKYKIVHAPSIFSVIAETGLQLYKFGETITIPYSYGNYNPSSWFAKISKNLSNKLHTLILLDIQNGNCMTVREALESIENLDKNRRIVTKKIVACSKLGTEQRKIVFGSFQKLKKIDFDIPACIIIPGNLHFKEEEALALWSCG